MNAEARLKEIALDLEITEYYFRNTNSRKAKEAINKLRELLIVASHDIKYKFGGLNDEYEENGENVTEAF